MIGTMKWRDGRVVERRPKAALRLALLLLLPLLGCGYGMVAYRQHWFPYQAFHTIRLMFVSGTKDASILETDPDSLISITTADDALALRRKLCLFLWELPESPRHIMPAEVTPAKDPRCDDLKDRLERIDEVVFNMEFGLNSRVYHFIPRKPNGALVLFHSGHDVDFFQQKSHIRDLTDRGFSVAAFCMPLMGLNNQPDVDVPRVGRLRLTSHDQMKFLVPKTGYPIKYFVEPVVGFLNYADKFHYSQISMIGLSGGGWTTMLAAAVDPRIQLSFPISGGYPIFLRVKSEDWGDWEQTAPLLYRTTTYLELFTLGAFGPGRLQCQVVNRYDSMSMAGDGWRTYADRVKNRVAALGQGRWDIFVDESHFEHIISDVALHKFIAMLDNFSSQRELTAASPPARQ